MPTGRSGEWLVERFEIRGEPAVGPGTGAVHDCARRRPGTYTRLKRGDTVFMTDLYDEWYTQRIAGEEACRRGGEVLITGLGLGLIVESVLRAPACPVERITVLELSREVIELVVPHLLTRYPDRLEIVQADAFSWRPPEGTRYSVAWHDVWPNPHAPEVFLEMERLEERYRSVCEWQGCWPREHRWVLEGVPRDREPATPRTEDSEAAATTHSRVGAIEPIDSRSVNHGR